MSGLTAGISYDLAIYSSFVRSGFNVDDNFDLTTRSLDWSTLTQGTHYVRFSTISDGLGQIYFTPDRSSPWSAFQVQPSAVPEPADYAMTFGIGCLGVVAWLRRRRTAA